MKHNEKGFGAVESVLVLVIVVLIGIVGFMVYNNNKKTNDKETDNATTNSSAKQETSTTGDNITAPIAKITPFVNVIQSDSSVMQATPDKIAKTSDETNILTALHNSCSGDANYVTVNHAVFDGAPNYKQDGNYAVINASVCDKVAKTMDDIGGSGAEHYLHKDGSGAWIFDASSQMEPSCANVDGLGYPRSIISTCFDDSTKTDRVPR